MGGEPDYYAILGVGPDADAAAIEAAYHSRSLRFRIGLLRDQGRELPGPSQAEVERAFAVLGDPQERARYDAERFPEAPPRREPPGHAARRRWRAVPLWLWGLIAVWLVVIGAVTIVGLRSRDRFGDDPIGRIIAGTGAATATARASATAVAAQSSLAVTPPPAARTATPVVAATTTAAPAPVASAPPVALAPTGTPTSAPSPTMTALPTATAMVPPSPEPTAAPPPEPTIAPPPEATPEPEPEPEPTPAPLPAPPPPPPPPPTAVPTPAFRPTDRVGTALPVNLRSGPGVNYPSQGLLQPGTLLAATGETSVSGGVLWRRFALADGRRGWIRDLDTFPVNR